MESAPVETTLYSLSDAPPPPDDRREGERHMTLYRVGSLSIGDRRELCLIKNISAGGMMVRAYCTVAEGTPLTVELKCGQPIPGVASWARDGFLGISFDRPIDIVDILATSIEGPRPRMPRIQLDRFVTLREGASIYRVRLSDISQGGMKVITDTPFEPDSDVIVTLPGIAPQPAVVRWADGQAMGVTFNRMLSLPILVEWLSEQRQALHPPATAHP